MLCNDIQRILAYQRRRPTLAVMIDYLKTILGASLGPVHSSASDGSSSRLDPGPGRRMTPAANVSSGGGTA